MMATRSERRERQALLRAHASRGLPPREPSEAPADYPGAEAYEAWLRRYAEVAARQPLPGTVDGVNIRDITEYL